MISCMVYHLMTPCPHNQHQILFYKPPDIVSGHTLATVEKVKHWLVDFHQLYLVTHEIINRNQQSSTDITQASTRLDSHIRIPVGHTDHNKRLLVQTPQYVLADGFHKKKGLMSKDTETAVKCIRNTLLNYWRASLRQTWSSHLYPIILKLENLPETALEL